MQLHGYSLDDSEEQKGAVRPKRSEVALVLTGLVGGIMMGWSQKQKGAVRPQQFDATLCARPEYAHASTARARKRGSIMTEERPPAPTTSSSVSRVEPSLTTGDPAAFSSLVEPYRRELQLHCYRLLGSLHEAEDLVQETILRAWQHFDTFKSQASLRTWLYQIATNACLDVLKRRPPRTLPVAASPVADPLLPLAPAWAESTWLEPFPNSWLAEVTDDPEARYLRRESISLAFLAALQLLPSRQRARLRPCSPSQCQPLRVPCTAPGSRCRSSIMLMNERGQRACMQMLQHRRCSLAICMRGRPRMSMGWWRL